MNTVTVTYYRSNQLSQSLKASKIQFIYQVYHAPSYAQALEVYSRFITKQNIPAMENERKGPSLTLLQKRRAGSQ